MLDFTGKEMIIGPAEQEVVDFSTDILKDLVAKGMAGEELISEFARIPQAFEAMKKGTLTWYLSLVRFQAR